MIDLINKEKNEKYLYDLDYFRRLIELNDSDFNTRKIDEKTYKQNKEYYDKSLKKLKKEYDK